MSPRQVGSFMMAAGGIMMLMFLLMGVSPNVASLRWLALAGCASGLVVSAAGYVIRQRDYWP